jgi:hypothetical protein
MKIWVCGFFSTLTIAGIAACGEETPASGTGAGAAAGAGGAGASGGGTSSSGTSSGGAGGTAPEDCQPLDLAIAGVAVTVPNDCDGSGSTPDACTSVGFTPLLDLGTGDYHGAMGGLYCGGSNLRPAQHEQEGLARAEGVTPRDAQGNPDPAGQYVLISVGMSNTRQEFSRFLSDYEGHPDLDPHLVIVNGALESQASVQWRDSETPWMNLAARLAEKGVTAAQVQIAWVKLARMGPHAGCVDAGFDWPNEHCFPADAGLLYEEMLPTLQRLGQDFPNLQLIYLSSRIYAGYATGGLNPEPYAYQAAFTMKALILDQITGKPELRYDAPGGVPWLAWGPYLWADGTTPRSDGLVWLREDLAADGTHPSALGTKKVADALFDFFSTDSTARAWFLASP